MINASYLLDDNDPRRVRNSINEKKMNEFKENSTYEMSKNHVSNNIGNYAIALLIPVILVIFVSAISVLTEFCISQFNNEDHFKLFESALAVFQYTGVDLPFIFAFYTLLVSLVFGVYSWETKIYLPEFIRVTEPKVDQKIAEIRSVLLNPDSGIELQGGLEGTEEICKVISDNLGNGSNELERPWKKKTQTFFDEAYLILNICILVFAAQLLVKEAIYSVVVPLFVCLYVYWTNARIWLYGNKYILNNELSKRVDLVNSKLNALYELPRVLKEVQQSNTPSELLTRRCLLVATCSFVLLQIPLLWFFQSIGVNLGIDSLLLLTLLLCLPLFVLNELRKRLAVFSWNLHAGTYLERDKIVVNASILLTILLNLLICTILWLITVYKLSCLQIILACFSTLLIIFSCVALCAAALGISKAEKRFKLLEERERYLQVLINSDIAATNSII